MFTIREAQWAARLRAVVQFDSLLAHASAYARRERACEALGMERVDTSDLQADLAFEGARGWGKDEACTGQVWALETAERLGLVPRHDFRLAETSVGKKELEILRQRRASSSFMWVVMEPPG